MLIKFLKATNCDGKRVQVGDVVDASNKDGSLLVNLGFAVAYVEPKKRAPKKKAAPVNRMESVEITRDAG